MWHTWSLEHWFVLWIDMALQPGRSYHFYTSWQLKVLPQDIRLSTINIWYKECARRDDQEERGIEYLQIYKEVQNITVDPMTRKKSV